MTNIFSRIPLSPRVPSWQLSAVPVAVLFVSFLLIIVFMGPTAVSEFSPWVLLGSSALALVLAGANGSVSRRGMALGIRRSATQILPAIPMLVCIAALATTWMLSGVVPTLVDYGLMLLNPGWFLVTTCAVCALVSVLTGSSWSTIATIGVAFVGIGSVMGYHPGWTAGAIISGAYFGDKVSPLSDTTVIASTCCGVDLFAHIRYMMFTTVPAMTIALTVFAIKGLTAGGAPIEGSAEMLSGLSQSFNITPWTLLIPLTTLTLIALKVNTLAVLAASALLGAAGAFLFQPGLGIGLVDIASEMWSGHASATGIPAVDQLCSTGGILGIMPVVFLVSSALVFGSVMIGTGMLASLTAALTRRLRRPTSIVAATVASGLTLNATTADQYLSIIIGGNMYRTLFRRHGMEPRLLSRTLEDSISATSPLIPWSSCGVTQSSVLGVATATYLPFCIFNYLTPLMALVMIHTGFKIRRATLAAR